MHPLPKAINPLSEINPNQQQMESQLSDQSTKICFGLTYNAWLIEFEVIMMMKKTHDGGRWASGEQCGYTEWFTLHSAEYKYSTSDEHEYSNIRIFE